MYPSMLRECHVKMLEKKVLITADDYGMCNEVNEAIRECIIAGAVTATNVLVNMEETKAAANLRTDFPDISVGIHWNVTTGKPVLDANTVKSLVDNNGYFWDIKTFKKRMNRKLINEIELEKELIAQYELFVRLCGQPDYWNTHEDSVLCYKAFKVFSKVAKEKRIRCTRNFQRVYMDLGTVSLKKRVREFMVSRIADLWFGYLVKRDFHMPDGKLFLFDFNSKLNIEKLVSSLKQTNKKIIEIIVHPSVNADNPLFGNISEQRVEEYKFFRQSKLRKILEESKLNLCNYNSITSNKQSNAIYGAIFWGSNSEQG